MCLFHTQNREKSLAEETVGKDSRTRPVTICKMLDWTPPDGKSRVIYTIGKANVLVCDCVMELGTIAGAQPRG